MTGENMIALEPSIVQENKDQEMDKLDYFMTKLSSPWSQELKDAAVSKLGKLKKPVVPLLVKDEWMNSLVDSHWSSEEPSKDVTNNKKRSVETTGKEWFDMPAVPTNDTETLKAVQLLHLRKFMYPNRFYKSLGSEKSKHRFYQIGTVQDQAEDFYSSRLSRRERKRSFTDEVLSDPHLKTSTKTRYTKIQAEKKGSSRKKLNKRIERTLPKWKRK
eukprot:jgi/Galph1/1931/GphlegSOOS_G600.1